MAKLTKDQRERIELEERKVRGKTVKQEPLTRDSYHLFIWQQPDLTLAYGKDAILVVAAQTIEEARGYLQTYLQQMPPLAPESPREPYLSEYAIQRANEDALRAHTNKHVLLATYGLEPPGDFLGHWYGWNWDLLLKDEPSRIVDLAPGILFAHYGYEG